MSAIRQALLLRDATSQMVLGATIYFQDEQGILRLGLEGISRRESSRVPPALGQHNLTTAAVPI